MMNDSIPLPGAAVQQAAIAIAKRRKMWAAIFFVLAGLFGLGFASLVNDPKPQMPRDQLIGGGIFWVAVLVMFGGVFLVRAGKVNRTGTVAATDPRMTWWLKNHLIVGADAQGVPQAAHTFRVTAKVETAMTAVPTLPSARTFHP